MTIKERVETVREEMARACLRSGRNEHEVTLIGVTKFVPVSKIEEAVQAGIRHVGENRAQEFTEKLIFYKQHDLHRHFIGQLQTNKVKYICGNAELIHSVDRESLLEAIQTQAAKTGIRQDVLLEVNIGEEPQKGGIAPDAVWNMVDRAAAMPSVRVRGLMCVPPIGETEAVRKYFQRMYTLFAKTQERYPQLAWDVLSMGMSHDYPIAIEEGATHVRVGTAIFGARNTTEGRKQNG